MSLFPQLIAGPIVRYSVVEQEVSNRRVTATDLSEGSLRVIVGLAKKVIIANNLYAIVTQFFGQDISTLSTLGTWYTVIVYSMYVYFDFSGYSDIAIGLGRMFGFHFDENFKHPFACKTIAEFWQRWHISLGSFLRDYLLYVPIFGKNRKYLSSFPRMVLHRYVALAPHGTSFFGDFISASSYSSSKNSVRKKQKMAAMVETYL